MVTRAVGDRFGTGGIADRMIRVNGYPFLDKEDHVYGVPGMTFRYVHVFRSSVNDTILQSLTLCNGISLSYRQWE